MSRLPKIERSVFVEREEGVLAVARIANDAQVIWRETPLHDVGIDGQLEYVDAEGFATGRIVAVQVKAGHSYFNRSGQGAVQLVPAERHRDYWRDFPVPVILALWDPVSESGVWADARDQLRRHSDRITLTEPLSRDGILAALHSGGLAIAAESYAFIDRYVAFLVSHDLARVDFDAFRRSSEQAGMVGVVLAPLTQRGCELVDFVVERDAEAPGVPSAARERPIQIRLDDLYERVARIQLLKTENRLDSR